MKYYIHADDVEFVAPIKCEADATRLQALLNDFTSWALSFLRTNAL